jgi:hypothetical protein
MPDIESPAHTAGGPAPHVEPNAARGSCTVGTVRRQPQLDRDRHLRLRRRVARECQPMLCATCSVTGRYAASVSSADPCAANMLGPRMPRHRGALHRHRV